MSSCMAFGMTAAAPISVISKAHGTGDLWVGVPKLVVVLAGGFTTNFIWCAILHARAKTANEFISSVPSAEALKLEGDVPESVSDGGVAVAVATRRVPLTMNYIFSAIAGVTWYLQFFFYSMGETQMGKYQFSSWTLHMSSIIIFSSLWGIGLHEWKGSSARTKGLLALGLLILVGSTVVIGYGNYLGVHK